MNRKKKEGIVENPIFKEFMEQYDLFFKAGDSIHRGDNPSRPTISRKLFENNIIRSSGEFRVLVIEATIQVESYFDEILSLYFCKQETKDDFSKMCLQQDYFPLGKKINLCKTIGKKIIGIDNLQKMFGKNYSSILDKISEQRNQVAHIPFNSKKFDLGDPLFFGDELNEKQTNKISIRDASYNIMFGARFAGEIISCLKKGENI